MTNVRSFIIKLRSNAIKLRSNAIELRSFVIPLRVIVAILRVNAIQMPGVAIATGVAVQDVRRTANTSLCEYDYSL